LPTHTHTGIGWYFQDNAWADSRYSKVWLRAFIKMLEDKGLGGPGKRHLLFLDDHKAQKVQEFNDIAMEGGVFPFPIPPGLGPHTRAHTHLLILHNSGMTDLLQPVDHNVGATMKKYIAALYKVQVELNYDEWRGYKANSSLAVGKRRVLMATWLERAWRFIQLDENKHVLEQAFVSTVLVKLDGSHQLSYRGLPDYQPPAI
jgi:hypothetical protein